MMCLARDVFIFCLPFFTTVSSMTTRAPTKDGQEHEEIASLPCMPTRGTSFWSPPRNTVPVYHIERFKFYSRLRSRFSQEAGANCSSSQGDASVPTSHPHRARPYAARFLLLPLLVGREICTCLKIVCYYERWK